MANILAVDDDGDLRALIAETLGRDGHFVRTLDSGSRIGEAHCRWADLILLDLLMPGEDGPAACRRIRAMTDAPILFLTALNGEADVLEALGSGGDRLPDQAFPDCRAAGPCGGSPAAAARPVSHRLVRGAGAGIRAGPGHHAGAAAGTGRQSGRPVGGRPPPGSAVDPADPPAQDPAGSVLASAELLAEEDLTPAQQEKAQTILRRAGEMQQTAARLRAMTLGARRKARD